MTFKNLYEHSSFAKIAKKYPLSFFDIGARGGFDKGLWPLAFASEAVGFEPDPAAFEMLAAAPNKSWKKTQYLPVAISGVSGTRTLNIPSDPQAASLLGPTKLYGPARSKTQFFNIIETHQVQTEIMDSVLEKFNLQPPEYLKIDIEGAELEALKSSPRILSHILAIKIEVAFDRFREDQPLASEVMNFLEQKGFVLMDLTGPSRWRSDGHVIHPHMDKTSVPYSRGQLVHGDFLYFRRPLLPDDSGNIDICRNLQLALIAMSFGFFDFAAEIIKEPSVQAEVEALGCVDPLKEVSRLSRRYGRIAAKKAFRDHLRALGPFVRRTVNLVFP